MEKISNEAVKSLDSRKPLLGANKTSVLIGKTFNIIGLNVTCINEKEIKEFVGTNEKLKFLLNEKFIFRGTIQVLPIGNKPNEVLTAYVNNDLLAILKKGKAITFKVKDGEVIHEISPKAVKLNNDSCELLGNDATTEADSENL